MRYWNAVSSIRESTLTNNNKMINKWAGPHSVTFNVPLEK